MPTTFPNYINGEWRAPAATFENRNPANTDEVVGLFAKGTARDVHDAAAAAQAALPSWSAMNGPAAEPFCSKSPTFLKAVSSNSARR